MSAFAWLRRPGRPSSPPEPLSSSESSGLSATRAAAGVRHAALCLRRGLSTLLLALPLLTLLATGAAAQTTVTFASGTYRVNEGDVLMPELVLSQPRSGDVTVMVETLDLGGARSGEDFAAGPWSVTVPAGETRQRFSIATTDDNQREGDEEVLLHISPYGHSSGVKRGSGGTPDAIVVIRDDDSRISLPKRHYIVSEGGMATIEVAIENPKPTAFTLDYTISADHVDSGLPGGTATAADVVGGFTTHQVLVPATATRVSFSVVTRTDSIPNEGEAGIERFSVRLSTGESDVEFGRRVATISISEHGAAPRVTFANRTSHPNEEWIDQRVKVILSPAPEMDAVVQVQERNRVIGGAGSATPDADYRIRFGDTVRRKSKSLVEIDVPAGASSVEVPLILTDDSDPEGGETVELRIVAVYVGENRIHDDREMIPNDRHTLTIRDNDLGVSFDTTSQSAGEGAGTRNVTVNLSRAPTSPITVNYTVSGTATAGSDFTIANSGTLSVSGGTTATIPVSILTDGVEDGGETVVLTLADGSGYRVSSPDTHTLHIDPVPEVTFDRPVKVVNEEIGTVDVKVNLSPAPVSDLTLNYDVLEEFSTATPGASTTTPGADYVTPSGTLTVLAGSTSATIPVTIINDNIPDSREWFNLRFLDGEGYRLGPRWRLGHTVFILNHDDLEGLVQARIDEAATNGDTASGNLWRRALAAVRGEAPPNGLAPLTEAEARAQADAETARGNAGLASLWTDIAHIVGATPATPESPSVPEVAIAGGADVAEGGAATFTVTAVPAPASPLTVDVTVTEAGGYAAAGTHQVTIPTGGSAVLTVATVDDAADEPDGTVTAVLAAGTGYTVSATAGSAGVAVTDGDATAVTLSAPAGAIVEGGGRKTLTLTLGRALVAGESVTVPLTLGGAAALGSDYTLAAPDATPQGVSYAHLGSTDAAHPPAVTFTGPSATAATVIVAAVADAVDEGAGEQVTVAPGTLEATGLGGGASGAGSGAFAIVEPAPVVVSIAPGAGVSEGEDATFTLSAAPAPASALSVTLAVSESAGSDFVDASSEGTATVVIPGGATGATFTVATTDDTTDEPDGTVTAVLAAGAGYTVSATAGSVGVAVTDDDAPAPATPTGVDPALIAEVRALAGQTHHGTAHVTRWRRVLVAFGVETYPGLSPTTAAEAEANAKRFSSPLWPRIAGVLAALEAAPEPQPQPVTLPVVTVAADAASVTEGGTAAFTLTATPPPPADLTVTVGVSAAGDYGITAGSRTVTIPPAGSFTLALATTGDSADEPDGSVTVTVADGAGYTVGSSASGTVAVQDDDEPLPEVTITVGTSPVTEGGDAVFTLTASPLPASSLAVSVTVAADGDYGIAGASRTVTIPTTGSFTLTLATADDSADEPDGSVTVTVNDGDGYTVGSSASGTVSVRDDDLPPPAVSITAAAASVTEGGAASFTVSADRAPDADLTVTLAVTEAAGGDHVAADDEGTATVTIAKGATEAAFPVATVDDAVDEPDGSVTVTVNDGDGYTVSSSRGAATVSVSDNDAAAGPVLSVADATVTEGEWAELMPFAVRLSAAQTVRVRVRASTRVSSPVSARPKEDYWPQSELVTFRPGETEKTVWVYIYNDSHDEDPETFEVVLSDADGATIGDGVAVGTIVNDDPMPAAWLARFGRTVAEQALDGIAGRMSADRAPGMQGSIAGQALSFDPAADGNPGSRGAGPGHAAFEVTGSPALADVAQAFGGQSGPAGFGNAPGSLSGTGGAGFGNGTQSRTMTARDALLGSSFSLTGETDGSGGSMAFWGRAAQGSFDGREGTFSLDGAVTTGMLGADYARGKWLAGLALAQSEGEGDYRDTGVSPRPDGQTCPADAEDGHPCNGAVRAGDGSVEASLTATIPYAALQASERLKLWGAAGYGTGEVTLKTAMGGSYRADTTWSMAAAGLRGDLLAPPAEGSGPALALTSDALWTRTSSEKTRDLAASESDATRLRLGLEGRYRMALEGGGSLVPKLEIGARHDGGDAETGFGVEIGGGIAWVDPGLGLSLDVSGRTLIAHGDDDLKDRGYAASLAFDPAPATRRGPSLSLRQEFGGRAQGGLDALFQPATLEDRSGSEATSRWAMEAAYGFPAFGGRWTGSPHVGLGLATAARDYSLGWRLTPEAANAPDLSFGLKAARRESGTAQPEHRIGFEINAGW